MKNTEFYTPKYHNLLKWAFVASLVIFILTFGTEYLDYIEYLENRQRERSFTLNKIIYQLYSLVFWSLIGHSIGRLKEGLIAFATSFMLIFIPSLFLDVNSNFRLSFFFLKFIPAFIFGFLVFKDKRKWQMYWLVLILAGASLINYGFEIIDVFSRMFRKTPIKYLLNYKIYGPDGNSYRNFQILTALLKAFSLFLSVAAGSWFLDRVRRGITPVWRSLDLSVDYSRRSSTLVFLISKYLILFGGLSLGQLVVQSSYVPNDLITNLRFSISSLEHIVGFFAVAAFFRCFLAEFLLSRGYKLGWHFFWLLIPIIGDLVWFINRTMDVRTSDMKERYKAHKIAMIHYPEGLKSLILLLTALSIILSIVKVFKYGGDTLLFTLVVGLVAFIFLALYFMSDKTIYWLIGLTAFSMISAIFFREEIGNLKFQYDNRISNISNAILFMVLFHLKSFKLYPTQECSSSIQIIESEDSEE